MFQIHRLNDLLLNLRTVRRFRTKNQRLHRVAFHQVGRFEHLEDRAMLSGESLVPDAVWFRADGDEDFIPPHDDALHGPGSGAEFQFDDVNRWTTTVTDGGGLAQGDPTTLTWGFLPDGTSIAGFRSGELTSDSNLIAFLGGIYGTTSNNTDYTDEPWFPLFESYLNRWGEVSGLSYVYEPNDDGAPFTLSSLPGGVAGVRGDIRIGGHHVDGESGSNTLAYNFFPNFGDMVIDTGNPLFYGNLSNTSINLRNVLSHEHGHGIGIGHVCPVIAGPDGRLMEPFINTSFDGPQFDDILATQRGYGDALEKGGGNDTSGTATALGNLSPGTPIVRGSDAADNRVSPSESDFISIDDDSDVDHFSFNVGNGVEVTLTLTPLGPTYLSGPQNGNGSCSAGTTFNASQQSDLTIELLDTNGTSVLEVSNINGLGGVETVVSDSLPSGTYFARVTGAHNKAQMYELSVSGRVVTESLSVTIAADSISEAGGMTTATVSRTGLTNTALTVSLSNNDNTELSHTPTVTIGVGSSSASFDLTGNDETLVDGTQRVTVTASATGLFDGSDTIDVTDNDSAGLSITETAGTVVSEAATTDSFDVVLTGQPETDVVLTVVSGDTSEATVDTGTLTFTTSNWDTTQTVTVTGVDDPAVDGDQATTITVSVEDSNSDDAFDALADQTVVVTTTDNDLPGFTIAESGGVTSVSESGISDSFSVVLDSQPLTNVVFDISSGDSTEVSVSASTLTFTPANWDTTQDVSVTGVDDFELDGDQTTSVTVSIDTAATDDAFDSLADQNVVVTTTDDDVPGFVASETSVTVSETGTSETFDVELTAQPSGQVVLTVTGDSPSEATVDVAALTFGPTDWNSPQTVTVTGVDDAPFDGDQTTTVTLSIDVANTHDDFDAVPDQTVNVITQDDEIGGFTLTSSNPNVTEAGSAESIDVVLTAQPLSDVVLLISSDDLSEVSVSPAFLRFSASNWDTAQQVTFTGVDDVIVDGDMTTNVIASVDDLNSHPAFGPLPDQTISITTIDDDVAGFSSTTSGVTVQEDGTSTTIDVVLDAEPVSDVVILVDNGDLSEVSLDVAALTFEPSTWNISQPVTVTGVDDFIVDGDQTTTITLSVAFYSATAFTTLADQSASITTTDNELPGAAVSAPTATVNEGGSTDTFDVALIAQPLSNVVVTVSGDDVGELAVSPSSLTFTPANWNSNQTVTVSGVDDPAVDGDQTSTVTIAVDPLASDSAFATMSDETVVVTTLDDDIAGSTVSKSAVTVSEAGASETFTVELTAQPLTVVVFDVSSDDNGEAAVDFASLTFTPADWNSPQTIKVTGVDDPAVDGDQTSAVTVAVRVIDSDAAFSSITTDTVSVTTTDDDVPGFLAGPSGISPIEGAVATFDVVLAAQPLNAVVFNVSGDNSAEATIDKSLLTFQPNNWDTPQTVTVTAVDDPTVDGDQSVTVTIAVDVLASGADFAVLPNQTIAVTTVDNDSAGFSVSESGGTTVTEAGSTDSIDVVLSAQPLNNVILVVGTTDSGEVVVNTTALLFTPVDWNVAQTVTLTGVDDSVVDGDITTAIIVRVDPNNSDDAFDLLSDISVNVTTQDDDVAGVTVTEPADTTVSEGGSTQSISIVLTAEPASDVVIAANSGDTTEVIVNDPLLTFSPSNWNVPQSVEVAGVDDTQPDGVQLTSISISVDAPNSADAFDLIPVQSVNIATSDDEQGRLDVDANGIMNAATDGLLAIRYLFGFTGTALTNNALGPGAQNDSPREVETALGLAPEMLDVDGDGDLEAATDGILILRYLLGFSGDDLVNDAIGINATRTTGQEVSDFLDGFLLPTQTPPVTEQPGTGTTGVDITVSGLSTGTPMFEWNSVTGTDYYRIRIIKLGGPVTDSATTSSLSYVTGVSLHSGSYRVWVEALGIGGATTTGLGWLDFTIADAESQDTQMSSLEKHTLKAMDMQSQEMNTPERDAGFMQTTPVRRDLVTDASENDEQEFTRVKGLNECTDVEQIDLVLTHWLTENVWMDE